MANPEREDPVKFIMSLTDKQRRQIGITDEEMKEIIKQRSYTEEDVMAILTEIWGPPPKKKPKVVTNEGEAIRDAIVHVGPRDPNYRKEDEGVVKVLGKDQVRIRMDLWEEQQTMKRMDRLRRRSLDPARLGIWGSVDDEDE